MSGVILEPQRERAPQVDFDPSRIRSPQYGRWLDDFTPGQLFCHPRGYTFERSEMRAFATAFHQANPIHLNVIAARAAGFDDVPASAQMVFNVVLSLGVQNNSEKAVANLGYYNARFLRPVYAGDTVRAMSRVHDIRDRGVQQPGIVHVHTVGVNQREEVVLCYERKIMIRHRPPQAPPPPQAAGGDAFPWPESAQLALTPPAACSSGPRLTGADTYFEDFQPGDVLVHACGRSITDEHMGWTYRLGNTHPLHFDRVYSTAQSGPMSGEPIVYGGLVFAWLEGLASRDLSENAIWELGFTEGYHTAPAVSGDTVYALSRILSCEPAPGEWGNAGHGVVGVQLIGVKNCTAQQALELHGADLFVKEGSKKALGKPRIAEKIFEIERELLIPRRGVAGG